MVTDAVQAMDLAQALQSIKWLDEERRKDKALIAALQERLNEQSQRVAQQEAQIRGLLETVLNLQTRLARAEGLEQVLANLRDELVHEMDAREDARRKEMAEAERLRRIEYEALTDHLHRIEKELQVVNRHTDELNARRAEEQRLSEALQRLTEQVTDLSRRSDERAQMVVYLEEQRRADNRRLTEIEHDIVEFLKRTDALSNKLLLLENALQKQKARIEEAVQAVSKYEKSLEELRLSDFQREQKMKQYLDQGELVAKELERVRTQTQGFIEQQQEVKRYLRVLEAFQARMEKQQTEVSEMQRLAEERLRRQWEEWQAEREKERKKQEVLTEERWRRQEATNDEHKKSLESAAAALERHQEQLKALWEARRNDVSVLLKIAQDRYDAVLAQLEEQLALLRGEGEV